MRIYIFIGSMYIYTLLLYTKNLDYFVCVVVVVGVFWFGFVFGVCFKQWSVGGFFLGGGGVGVWNKYQCFSSVFFFFLLSLLVFLVVVFCHFTQWIFSTFQSQKLEDRIDSPLHPHLKVSRPPGLFSFFCLSYLFMTYL